MRRTFLAILILGGAITAYGYYSVRTVEFVPDVNTVAVTEGDIVDTVGATGALEAVTTVQVGSQVSGIIQELYVDFNSIVREGDVIMRLDPSLFETQLEQARATSSARRPRSSGCPSRSTTRRRNSAGRASSRPTISSPRPSSKPRRSPCGRPRPRSSRPRPRFGSRRPRSA